MHEFSRVGNEIGSDDLQHQKMVGSSCDQDKKTSKLVPFE